MSAIPTRNIPQELIDLAVRAIKSGASSVSLGHERLDDESRPVDLPAPVGWILFIGDTDHAGNPRENMAVISHRPGGSFDEFVLPSWLGTDPDSSSARSSNSVIIEEVVELFAAGMGNGWDISFQRQIAEQLSEEKLARENGRAVLSGMPHRLRGLALNWAYNMAHGSDEHLSTEVVLSTSETTLDHHAPSQSAYLNVETWSSQTHANVDADRVRELLTNTAPDFVPVAYFDDAREEWVL